jgi:hypothetical protein
LLSEFRFGTVSEVVRAWHQQQAAGAQATLAAGHLSVAAR